MGVKVYGAALSTATARATITMEEMGVAYEVVPVDLRTGEHKQPAFLAMNPFGQVPAAEDGDIKLFESRAISRYIAHKYKGGGAPDLLGESCDEKSALVQVWMEVEAQHYDSAITAIVMQALFVPIFGGVTNEAIVAENKEKLSKVLDVYEDLLSKSKYLAGDFLSLADLHHVPFTFLLMVSPHGVLISDRPHVKAWFDGMMARPAVKKITDAMAAAAAAMKPPPQ